jgi:hypothetical protein
MNTAFSKALDKLQIESDHFFIKNETRTDCLNVYFKKEMVLPSWQWGLPVVKCWNSESDNLFITMLISETMDHLHYRLNFDLDKNFNTA